MSSRVWFMTGASRGLGRQWAIAALDRGDRVAAAARDLTALADLRETYGEAVEPIPLDVTDRGQCSAAVRAAHDRFDRIDIVVNNAGYGQYGFVEELSEDEARAQMDTNFFGALWVTQAALPYLRDQRSGHEWERWQSVAVAAHGDTSAQETVMEGMVPRGAFEASPEK